MKRLVIDVLKKPLPQLQRFKVLYTTDIIKININTEYFNKLSHAADHRNITKADFMRCLICHAMGEPLPDQSKSLRSKRGNAGTCKKGVDGRFINKKQTEKMKLTFVMANAAMNRSLIYASS